jgi:HAD superfamily hydrolase (TIGR01509 family)
LIKLVIFDLDGVLADIKSLHYEALNQALVNVDEKFVISVEDHLAKFDGLPTMRKLTILNEERGLPRSLFQEINKVKQELTRSFLKERLEKSPVLIDLFSRLKAEGLQIYVASNAIRDTIKTVLMSLGILEFVDYTLSNQDVRNAKPNPEIYLRSIMDAGICPSETLILEDSPVGRSAAYCSGAHVLPVDSSKDVCYSFVQSKIARINDNQPPLKWNDEKLVVLIPMAGQGTRFATAGYKLPKPLISVNGKPMIQTVVENLAIEAEYVFIVQKQHCEQYALEYLLNLLAPQCKIVQIDQPTEGAACTTLLAKEYIDNHKRLFIANTDQYTVWNSCNFFYSMVESGYDACVPIFHDDNPKWSYSKVGIDGLVTEVAEKRVISDNANVGYYYWKHGSDYVKYAEQMIAKNIRVNNEFYICPVFNEAIADGKKIAVHEVAEMWGLGVPEDLERYLAAHGGK